MKHPGKALGRLNSTIAGEIRWSLVVLACLLVMLISFVISIRGDQHWTFSSRDQDGGMTIWIRLSDSDRPVYTVIVKGYRLGRDVAPLLIDGDERGFPEEMARTSIDTTFLPGQCALQIGPLHLNVMPAYLIANDKECEPGGEITVEVSSAP